MKKNHFKYLLVLLLTLSVFHLTGAECDEDDTPTGESGTNQALISKWISTTNDTVKRWMEITDNTIKIYELWKETGEPWPDQLFAQEVIDGEYQTPYEDTITVNFLGNQLNVGFSVNTGVTPKTLKLVVPAYNNDVLDFDAGDFTLGTTFKENPNLIGTWKNVEAEEYLRIVDFSEYEIWVKNNDCYMQVQSDDYEFTSQFKGEYDASDLQGGKGSFEYNETNGKITITYTPLATSNSGSALEIVESQQTDIFEKVTDIDFEASECLP